MYILKHRTLIEHLVIFFNSLLRLKLHKSLCNQNGRVMIETTPLDLDYYNNRHKKTATTFISKHYGFYKYSRRESNPHDRSHWILNPARLPIPPLEQIWTAKIIKSYE